MICELKVTGTKLFAKYQSSGMGTQNWNILDHVIFALKDFGGSEYVPASCFESDHHNSKNPSTKVGSYV